MPPSKPDPDQARDIEVGDEVISQSEPERQRVLIAEWCGWKYRPLSEYSDKYWFNGKTTRDEPPDYLNDLNAMHEAVSHLSFGQRGYFNAELFKCACNGRNLSSAIKEPHFIFQTLNATDAQRAEALLRTLGKLK